MNKPTAGHEMEYRGDNYGYKTPLGFEGIAAGDPENPPPTNDNLYPPLEGNGPTPVETSAPRPIGFEGTEDGINGSEKPVVSTEAIVEAETQNNTGVINLDTEDINEKRETLFFRDGKRKIDFVLAYKESTSDNNSTKEEKRETFEQNLEKQGLELEYEHKQNSQDGKTGFIKVHAPWDVLGNMADLMSLKMPIKMYDISDDEMTCTGKFPNPFELDEALLPEEPDYFTAAFSVERQSMFLIPENKDEFFSSCQRSLMVYELMLRVQYDDLDANKFGIDRLVKHGVYSNAFPLHEGPYISPHSILTTGPNNPRHLLHEAWARPGRWYFNQPLDYIRSYFGEKIGIYFSWLGFYTTMLIPASLVGLIVFIYGCATVFQNAPSEEICDPNLAGNYTMCPLCDKRCSYWRLKESCNYSRLTYLFDNYATVFFAGFMAIWATMFLEFWKRKQAEIRYDWDVADFELEEHVRPDFEAKCTKKKLNPVTQTMDPYMPIYSKISRKFTSIFVILFMVSCVLAAVFGVIMYRIIIVAVLYASDQTLLRNNAKIATTATAACINLVLIMLLNRIYERIALWLTNLERPRTDSEYEDSFTFKMFLFQFINYYASIFYIAFFKGRFKGSPGDHRTYLFNKWRSEECDPAGCLIELCLQLGIVMVGKQALNNFKEIMLPKILNWCRARNAIKHETEENLYTRWEQDNDLQDQPELGLFDEYLEMVIQYGFITIFVAAFPLAPLFALINNVIEVRLDAYKFVTQWKRPIAQRGMDIGIWYGILQGITFIAVLTNAFIIGWTSDFVPKMVYKFTTSPEHSMNGYVNNSLSYFAVQDFQSQSQPENNKTAEFGVVSLCRYSDYRYPPWSDDKYEFTRLYWHVFCARLAFVIAFEHCVFMLTWLVQYLIPDVPARVKMLMLRELHLAKEARYNAAFTDMHQDRDKLRQLVEATSAKA